MTVLNCTFGMIIAYMSIGQHNSVQSDVGCVKMAFPDTTNAIWNRPQQCICQPAGLGLVLELQLHVELSSFQECQTDRHLHNTFH